MSPDRWRQRISVVYTDGAGGGWVDPRTLGNGRYELLEQIGQGGMATVWRARDTRLGVERAVKILAPKGSTSTTTARDRFDREARLMAQLEHPHVVPVHDVGVENGRIYMVMSLFRGGSVADYLERHGPMPPRLASFVAEGVLKALGTAHSSGVIHRDVKPQNILIDDHGLPRLTDFGIARVLQEDGQLTRTGAVMGTYAFMAPEQRGNAREADPRSDIYAVGALIVMLVTGQIPYDLHHPEAFAAQTKTVPEPLRAWVDKAVRFSPAERHASAEEALRELVSAVSELPPDPEHSALSAPQPQGDPQNTLYTLTTGGSRVLVPQPESSPTTIETASKPPRAPWLAYSVGLGLILAISSPMVLAALVLLALSALLPGWNAPRAEPDAADVAAPSGDIEPLPEPSEPPEGGEIVSPEAPAPKPPPAVPVSPPAAPRPEPTKTKSPVERPPEPPKPETVAPEPPAAQTETVRVAADPSSALEIDGSSVGSTPWSGPLPHGSHTLVFRKPDGSIALRRPITVAAGGKLEYCWVLATEEPCSR